MTPIYRNENALNSTLPFASGLQPVDPEDYGIVLGANLVSNVLLRTPPIPKIGHMTFAEMALIAAVSKSLQPANILEFGTFDGVSTGIFLDNTKAKIVTVDLPLTIHEQKGEGCSLTMDPVNAEMLNLVKIGSFFEDHPERHRVTQVFQDTALFETSESFDFILIDACHTYEYCKSDSEKALEMIRPGGIIVWHDYGKLAYLSGVTKYLLELSQERSLYWLESRHYHTSLVLTIA